MNKIFLPILTLGSLAASYAALEAASSVSGLAQEVRTAASDQNAVPEDSALRTDSALTVDTVSVPSAAELKVKEASGLYKTVKFMLYEGCPKILPSRRYVYCPNFIQTNISRLSFRWTSLI